MTILEDGAEQISRKRMNSRPTWITHNRCHLGSLIMFRKHNQCIVSYHRRGKTDTVMSGCIGGDGIHRYMC